ncbi:hypothetical protein ACN6AT_16310 [Streptomyces sp. JL4002]|uniref:hypothetical protein n=1 Tax=Streptomyces sp. JL4002 TaxID=3404781 RepID=UPI003B285FD2
MEGAHDGAQLPAQGGEVGAVAEFRLQLVQDPAGDGEVFAGGGGQDDEFAAAANPSCT